MSRFTHALLRQPAPNIADGITEHAELGKPDFALTLRQFEAYQTALKQAGISSIEVIPNVGFPDGHYIEDTAVIYAGVAFITRLGANARQAESDSMTKFLAENTHLKLERLTDENATIEGGDVLFCADRVLIGLSQRTNLAGAEWLKQGLQKTQPNLLVEFVPFEGVLHLKTGLTELAPNVLVKSPQMVTESKFAFAQVIDLPIEESYCGCILPINESILIPAGYPTILEVAQGYYGDKVLQIAMSEFEKMDGGLTCLSLRYHA